MYLSKCLIVYAVLCIGSNASTLFSKNTNAVNLASQTQRPSYGPAGDYICIDYMHRPLMKFKVLFNATYVTSDGKTGNIYYNEKLDANKRRSVTWSGDLKKWDESFYMEEQEVKTFVLLGKNDQRKIVIPSCNWVNPSPNKQ